MRIREINKKKHIKEEFGLAGATPGMKIMSPAQFVAKANKAADPDKDMAEGTDWSPSARETIKQDKINSLKNLITRYKEKGNTAKVKELTAELKSLQGVTESKGTLWRVHQSEATGRYHVVKGYNKDMKMFKNKMGAGDFNSKEAAQAKADELNNNGKINELSTKALADYKVAAGADARAADKSGDFKRGNKRFSGIIKATKKQFDNETKPKVGEAISNRDRIAKGKPTGDEVRTKYYNKAMASMFGGKDTDEQKNKAAKRYFKIKGITDPDLVKEATTLPAPARELKGQELTDYLDRIRGKEKKKTDKYKLPYIHRSDVVKYYSADGTQYDVDAIKKAISQRPAKLLKKNEKMKHSDGTYEQFFNVGFAALVGLALDESTNELIVVNTCPGAGSCKIDCFAMKGGKVQFAPAWMSDSRILTYLLNDPDGFFNQLKSEITAEVNKGAKKDIKVSIRWHDAGDFFSPEYVALAFKLARELPMVDFYAYTKVADVALGNKPANFMINWSEGAHPSQERKVKAGDPELETTKNSRIVPSNLFYDLLVKDEKKNLVKGPENQWQVIPEKLPELKDRLAREYGLSKNSILSYSEWDSKVRGRDKSPLKYNVIIAPGEPDLTAKDAGVLSTLLLKH